MCIRDSGNFSSTGNINDAAAAFTRDIYSVYAQDDWQINDSLSAVIGVPADWYLSLIHIQMCIRDRFWASPRMR